MTRMTPLTIIRITWMSKAGIIKAQKLLYTWIGCYEKRSYTQIKEACAFLNSSYDLGLGDRPVWELFYPMLYSGVIDHVGKEYYSLTSPVALAFETHAYLLNCGEKGHSSSRIPIGYTEVASDAIPEGVPVLRMNTLSVLKSFPAVDDVVDTWQTSVLDEEQLTYHDTKARIGVAEYTNGHTLYFSVPGKNYLKEMPSRALNPDAFNIGTSFERVLNGRGNGRYDREKKELRVRRFAFPLLLYRSLSIDGMSVKAFPESSGEDFVFKNVSPATVKEVNRILCKSIAYE